MTDFVRSFPLLDIDIRSGGDGRTVEAYAAVWDTPTEIADGQGRYREQIHRSAFNDAIARSQRYPVLFNHGLTAYGTPSDQWSAPVGVTSELRADQRGLVSVWRADATPRGDEVLEMIRSGSVAGQSFSGRFTESTPKLPRGGYGPDKRTGELPLVTRNTVMLRELGPTPFPAYAGAAILGTRAEQIASQISAMTADERAELVRALSTPDVGQDGDGTPDVGAAAVGQPAMALEPAQSIAKRLREFRSAQIRKETANVSP